MHFGIIVFPGTNWQHTLHVVSHVLGHSGALVWHESSICRRLTRSFCLAASRTAIPHRRHRALFAGDGCRRRVRFDRQTGFICNGFQILCEAGLLPPALCGAITACTSSAATFICASNTTKTMFLHSTNIGDVLRMPIRHGEGSYYVDPDTLADMERNAQIVLRYAHADGTASWRQ